MESTALTIHRVLIESLHLDPANAREHGPENMDAIVGSLKRFGQAEPLVVQDSTGRVIGGNGRLVAMKQLGWTESSRDSLSAGRSSGRCSRPWASGRRQ